MKKIGTGSLLAVLLVASVVMLSGLTASAAGKTAPENATTAQAEKLVPVANAKCPIMETVMEKKVPENLTRMYKGQRIGFCCSGCLGKWDAMTDAQRDASLKDAMTPVKK